MGRSYCSSARVTFHSLLDSFARHSARRRLAGRNYGWLAKQPVPRLRTFFQLSQRGTDIARGTDRSRPAEDPYFSVSHRGRTAAKENWLFPGRYSVAGRVWWPVRLGRCPPVATNTGDARWNCCTNRVPGGSRGAGARTLGSSSRCGAVNIHAGSSSTRGAAARH